MLVGISECRFNFKVTVNDTEIFIYRAYYWFVSFITIN